MTPRPGAGPARTVVARGRAHRPAIAPALAAGAVAVAVAGLAALVFDATFVSGDMVFALVWGDQLLHGELTTFTPGPTPHPLPIAWGALASLLGGGTGYQATQVLWGYLALGAVTALVAAVAWQAWSAWAGAVAAVLLLTSGSMASLTFQTGYDLAFAALALAALWLEMHRRRRSRTALALLAVAGLLRPEGWVLAGLYWAWAWRDWTAGQRAQGAALVAAAPAVWCGMDLAVTGDALWSLHVTESGSEDLYQQYTPAENLGEGVRDVARYVGPFGVVAAVAGLVLARRRRDLWPAWALLAVTGGIFVALTLAGMASNARYLLLPACVLAVAAGGAASAASSSSRRRVALAVALSALLGIQTAGRLDDPLEVRDDVRPRAEWATDARRLVADPAVARILAACERVAVPSYRLVPSFAYLSGRAPGRWTSDRAGRSEPDAYLAPASADVAEVYLTRRRFITDAGFTVPTGLRPVAGTPAWVLHASPGAACARRPR